MTASMEERDAQQPEIVCSPESIPACNVREVLDRVGDRWTLYVVSQLGSGTKRFTELKREVPGISQRMLTVTLRGLERDGILTRTVHPVIPPKVEYTLTPMGRTLLDSVMPVIQWAGSHLEAIAAARAAYDDRTLREAATG